MNKKIILLITVVVSIGLFGCAKSDKYQWGSYERSLYKYYKKPGEVAKLGEKLADIIEKGENKGNVPPGIYAEYGYVLYLSGMPVEAIGYFNKEKEFWLESRFLMDRMIAMAEKDLARQKRISMKDKDKVAP